MATLFAFLTDLCIRIGAESAVNLNQEFEGNITD